MKLSTILSLFLVLTLVTGAQLSRAQEPEDVGPEAPSTGETPPGTEDETVAQPEEEVLTYDDYNVKGYSLNFYGGSFSGARYLENKPLGPRTVLTPGAGDILGYDGEVLRVSQDADRYTGAHKEIESGVAFGGRIGIYISENFHLDLIGSYAKGEAVTTMLFTEDPENAPDKSQRIEVDRDDGFGVIKGGLNLTYDATPATFFGILPRIGFGLGGIINSYSVLPDVTALYLEGNVSLNYEFVDDLALGVGVDVTNFAFEVPELGYSEMVNYYTFSAGLTWFIDVIPGDIRAAHEAAGSP